MHLHCTQKLLKSLALPNNKLTQPSPNQLLSWHAHIVTIERSKTIIAINNQNFFALIMPEMKKEQLKNFSNEFYTTLLSTMKSEGFTPSHAEILWGDDFLFSKAHDRKIIGIINQIVKDLKFQVERAGGWNFVNVIELTKLINRTPWLASTKKPVFPIEQMKNDLSLFPR